MSNPTNTISFPQLSDRDIPILAEIEPHPDPVYGHLFRWPPEIDQYLAQTQTPNSNSEEASHV